MAISKTELEDSLREFNEGLLRAELENRSAFIRKIQRMLYHQEEAVRIGAARAFGLAAEVFETERMKDLIRQLVWMINEESGNNCWYAPHALGEIGKVRPDYLKDFIPCLLEFYKYPNSGIKRGLEYAFRCFTEAGLDVPELSDDPAAD